MDTKGPESHPVSCIENLKRRRQELIQSVLGLHKWVTKLEMELYDVEKKLQEIAQTPGPICKKCGV